MKETSDKIPWYIKAKLKVIHEQNLLNNKLNLKSEITAVEVIKDKIKHFEETGNHRKLKIYMSKLKGKQPIIANLRKLTRQ